MAASQAMHGRSLEGSADRGPAVFAVATVTLVLATVFVAARVACRAGLVRHVTWDDYIIVLACLFALSLTVTIDQGVRQGLGRHDTDIEADSRPGLRRCEYAFSVLYNPALMATKTSILTFYLRLSKNTQKILRGASWVVLVVVNVAGAVLTLTNIFQCRPVGTAFDTSYPGDARCIPLLTEFICSAPVNIVTDLAILALPIPVLTAMRLPPRQKTILVATFALGVFVTVVDVVRVYYLQQAITTVPTGASNDPSAIFGDTPDFAWNASLSLMWSAVEVNVGIICACIPTLKPLITRILPTMLLESGRADTSSRPQAKENNGMSVDGVSKPDGNGSLYARDPAPTAGTVGVPLEDQLDMEEQVTAMDALASADTPSHSNALANRLAAQPVATASTVARLPPTKKSERSVYFGFVNLEGPKSMLKASASESLKFCGLVTILFFLWGFSYGLLNTLNNAVATVANMSTAQTLGLTSAYFGGGYFFGPLLVGEWLLRHDEHRRSGRGVGHNLGHTDAVGGFKVTFIAGLLIYGAGTIMFWPSAVLTAFGGFMVSNFVVGFGLGVLETAANPFLALCGPPGYEAMRLLLAQGVQGVGSVLSGLLAQRVFSISAPTPGSASSSTTLLDVQWTYLAVTLFCVLLALVIYYMPLPEVTDSELEAAAGRLPVDPGTRSDTRIFGYTPSLRTTAIILAVAAQWTYVAGQESMSIFFGDLLTTPSSLALSVPDYLLVAHTAFAVSRFGAGYMAFLSAKHPRQPFLPSPRTVLLTSTALAILFAILIVAIDRTSNPNLVFVPIVLFFLAEGPLWPLIFALGLIGQGRRTKRAAAWLTMGASGPAFWPFVMYAIVADLGRSIRIAFTVVIALLVVTLIYPLYLTLSRNARSMTDPDSRERTSAPAAGGRRNEGQPQGQALTLAEEGMNGWGEIPNAELDLDRSLTQEAAGSERTSRSSHSLRINSGQRAHADRKITPPPSHLPVADPYGKTPRGG